MMLIATYIFIGIWTVAITVYGVFMTSNESRIHKSVIIFGVVCFILVILNGISLIIDKIDNDKERNELKSQTYILNNALKSQATTNDIKHLEETMINGFSHLESVIKGEKPVKPLVNPPSHIEPAVVEHIRIIQRRVNSDKEDAPYGLQVVMQTDVPIQPVAFRMEFDNEISNGDVFIVGEGIYTMMYTKIDHKVFIFSFRTPALTPSSSLIVTVQSKYDIRITKIDKIHPPF